MTQQNNDGAYGWDTQKIENPDEGGFKLLPEGEYNFTVTKLTRARHEGSAKLSACNKAIISLEIDAGELGTAYETTNLFLHRNMDGLNCQFFVCVGLRKHGDDLILDWNRLVGCRGRCRISTRTYDQKQYNNLKFLDPPEGGVSPAPSPAPSTAPSTAQQPEDVTDDIQF